MAPHRERDPASLLARVRWANLARLAAIVGAGVLIAVGPRGCGGGAEELPALPVDPPAAAPEPPPALAPEPQSDARPERPAKPRERQGRRRTRANRRARRPNPSAPKPAPAAPPAAPVTPAAPAPRRRWFRPAPRAPEFL